MDKSPGPITDETSRTAKPARPLQRMFEAVPERYDICNRLLTLGMDEGWRRLTAKRCLEDDAKRVLDLCCGTGDLVLQIARQAKTNVELTGLDFSAGMLELARRKAQRSDARQLISFVEGDATAMPFPSEHFDSVGIAFGFRNLTWRNPLKDDALAEVRRVLKPGGRFVIVETSQPVNPFMRWGCHTYLSLVAAPLGGLISGNPAAYKYLAQSARSYFTSSEVIAMLEGAGFKQLEAKLLLGGVAALHVARV